MIFEPRTGVLLIEVKEQNPATRFDGPNAFDEKFKSRLLWQSNPYPFVIRGQLPFVKFVKFAQHKNNSALK